MFTVACAYTLPLLQGRPVAAIKVGSWDPGCPGRASSENVEHHNHHHCPNDSHHHHHYHDHQIPGWPDLHLREMWNASSHQLYSNHRRRKQYYDIIITTFTVMVVTIVITIITVTIIIKPPGWHQVHLLRLWGLGKCGLETPISCIIREEGGAHAIRVTGFNLVLSPMRNTRAL